jgi:hypothetical protein
MICLRVFYVTQLQYVAEWQRDELKSMEYWTHKLLMIN